MAAGKWISGLSEDTPIVKAAEIVLGARLKIVSKYLESTLNGPPEDVEHVHQLRVGTRRCRAALDCFDICLSSKSYRRIKQLLGKIRRAAGPARDKDIIAAHLFDLCEDAPEEAKPGLYWLAGQTVYQRNKIQADLERELPLLGRKLKRAVSPDRGKLCSMTNRAESHKTLGILARHRIAAHVGEIQNRINQGREDYEHFHEIRIAGKRLRYAIEILHDCVPGNLKQTLYPHVEELQENLGGITDSAVTVAQVEELWQAAKYLPLSRQDQLRPGFDYFVSAQNRNPEELSAQFVVTRFSGLLMEAAGVAR